MDIRKLKVAVLYGGIGEERDVSLESGSCVVQGLKEACVETVAADITPSDMSILDDGSVDVFFPVLHGRFGEDGQLQRILEDKGLVYCGSGPDACEKAFDKMLSKKAFIESGADTPAAIAFCEGTTAQEVRHKLGQGSDKYVVKPRRQGSSVGVSIVSGAEDAAATAKKTLAEFGDCMIEEFIAGREITVGILCGRALPIIEIRPKQSFYNYHAKYVDDATEFLFDTIDNAELVSRIEAAAMKCFKVLGLKDFARIDFILDGRGGVFVLEANTIPGMTSHSLLPKAAGKVGMTMSRLCCRIVEAAVYSRNGFLSGIDRK